jgi:transposase-like protein
MKCSICADKARKRIDAALVREGATIRGIAATFSVSEDSLARHVKNGHVLARIAKSQKAQDIVEADDLLKEIKEVENQTKDILKECREDRNHRDALGALTRREKQIELKGTILGSFKKTAGDKPIKIEWITIGNDAKDPAD